MIKEKQPGLVLWLLLVFAGTTGLLLAVETGIAAESSASVLMNKKGHQKRFTKIEDKALPESAKIAAAKAKHQSGDLQNAGEVYYKNGLLTESNRYITTGRIVVRFARGTQVDLVAFASKHGLTLEKSMGKENVMVVFVNESPQNDIEQSNALLREKKVISAQPDWVLPLQLY